MKFTIEDKQDYMNYLANEIKKTSELPETLFNNHYITNLYKDMINIKNNLK